MALYYDIGAICRQYDDDKELVKGELVGFISSSSKTLKLIKKAIVEKNYVEVLEYLNALKPSLEFLGLDQALEELVFIEKWTQEKGKIKEVKENFKSFKVYIKKANKEIKKDFSLS